MYSSITIKFRNKKILNKVIELNNMNYDRLLNDEYFDSLICNHSKVNRTYPYRHDDQPNVSS